MPILESCVVCGFRLPCVKRRDTRYCNRVCRARAHRARCLKRNPAVVRVHYTTLRRMLLAYWFVGLRHRCGMRPLKPEELVERLAQTLSDLEAARHQAALLRAQIAKLEFGQHTANDGYRAELEALREKLRAAEEEVARLQQELDAAGHAVGLEVEQTEPSTALEPLNEQGTPASRAELPASLPIRVAELMPENESTQASASTLRSSDQEALNLAQQKLAALEAEREVLKKSEVWYQQFLEAALKAPEVAVNSLKKEIASLKESASAQRSSHETELRTEKEKVAALEQEKTATEMNNRTLTRELLQAREDLDAANQKLLQKERLVSVAAKTIRRLQGQDSLDLKAEPDEEDDALDLRAELKRVKQKLRQTAQELDRAHEQLANHLAAELNPEQKRAGSAPVQRVDLKQALAERDAARQEARNARAELEQRTELQLAEKARQFTAHRDEGPYEPSKDRLLRAMLDELSANADLARQQYIHDKPQTARLPHPYLSPAQHAHALAMAARWRRGGGSWPARRRPIRKKCRGHRTPTRSTPTRSCIYTRTAAIEARRRPGRRSGWSLSGRRGGEGDANDCRSP